MNTTVRESLENLLAVEKSRDVCDRWRSAKVALASVVDDLHNRCSAIAHEIMERSTQYFDARYIPLAGNVVYMFPTALETETGDRLCLKERYDSPRPFAFDATQHVYMKLSAVVALTAELAALTDGVLRDKMYAAMDD